MIGPEVLEKRFVQVPAHQVVVGTQSPVFSRLLEAGVVDGRLAVKEVPGEVLRVVVDYIYRLEYGQFGWS